MLKNGRGFGKPSGRAIFFNVFRRVDIPPGISGKLLLHSMPGRFETLESAWAQLESEAVQAIVCLNERHEIREKSARYAQALEADAPEDRAAFWAVANDVAKRLRCGEAVLIHCAGGVGRTAMLAVSVLLA